MSRLCKLGWIIKLILFMPFSFIIASENLQSVKQLEKRIQHSLSNYCADCHWEGKKEGGLALDDFYKLNNELKFDVLNRVEEQLYLEKMPPKDEDAPTVVEREKWLKEITQWYDLNTTKSNFKKKLKGPEYGNYVDHVKLFSGKYKHLKAFTYDRNWLLSEYIFIEKINRITGASGNWLTHNGEKKLFKGKILDNALSNPFLLPKKSGVRYYANDELSSSHFLTMLSNVEHITNKIIAKSESTPSFIPALSKLTQIKAKHDSTLIKRKDFLTENIDRICEDIYKEKNHLMFPVYKETKLQGPILKKNTGLRMRDINSSEKDIVLSVKKFHTKDITNLELIRKCERHWYNTGLDEASIVRKVNVLRKAVNLIRNYRNIKNYKKTPYKALSSSEMKEITSTIKKVRRKGMSYNTIIEKCMSLWQTNFDKSRDTKGISQQLSIELIQQLYQKFYERRPNQIELRSNLQLLESYLSFTSVYKGVRKLIETLLLDSEFMLRNEFGSGKADKFGRRMLSPRNASFAIAYALTDSSPDKALIKAAKEGRLNSREDYKREIKRLLKNRSQYYTIFNLPETSGISSYTNTPIRKLRFFRDFFGYPLLLEVFKDVKRFGAKDLQRSRRRLLVEADRLVDHILQKDKNVIQELLTTDKFYVFHNGNNNSMLQVSQEIKQPYDFFKNKNWQKFTANDLKPHKSILKNLIDTRSKGDLALKEFKSIMTEISRKFSGDKKYIFPIVGTRGAKVAAFKGNKRRLLEGTGVTLFYSINRQDWDYNPVQPMKIKNRKGILTHPAWLQAFSQNDHSDPVIRGKWIREKLLAGTVPDVPITVDAVIPENHTKTLRERLHAATQSKECWRCHEYMNPLGYAFEDYDDFGRYRTREELEHKKNILNEEEEKKVRTSRRSYFPFRYKTKPVNSTGLLTGTGDTKLDGKVKGSSDLIERLAKSDRVRQSIIRYAFRYFMGRNEMLTDSKTLIDADQAYLKSGGSFDAVIISLLTSDSFIYRKETKE